MKIVVLDSQTLNPGDLSWKAFEALGDCQVYEKSTPNQVISRATDAEVIIVNKVLITRAVMEQLPRLKYIIVTATGWNNIDIPAAKEKNILVSNARAYSAISVAQHTLALLLELTNHVGLHDQAVQSGEWSRAENFCFWKKPIIELADLTIGIFGYGAIGQSVAKIASAFDMKVLVAKRNISAADKKSFFQNSDIISLHCPLSDETRHLINAETLQWMKPTAMLINTARGELIDEPALAKALKENKIYGAAIDVLSKEPPKDSPLIGLENCIITPHIAWASRESRQRLLQITLENLRAYVAGKPQNLVSG